MPGQKRRRFLIRRKAKERKARQKQTTLTPEERERINDVKAQYAPIAMMSRKGYNHRDLEFANRAHNCVEDLNEYEIERSEKPNDLFKDILELHRTFPGQRIRVLIEGAGESRYGEELSKKASDAGIVLDIVKTDIDPERHDAEKLSPCELIERFGKGSFHMVESCNGGVMYTNGNQEKAIANVVDLLKPGGIAQVVSQDNNVFTGGRRVDLETMRRILRPRTNLQVHELCRGKSTNLRIKKHKS